MLINRVTDNIVGTKLFTSKRVAEHPTGNATDPFNFYKLTTTYFCTIYFGESLTVIRNKKNIC